MKHPPIFFLTDFGTADIHVGVMKAVVAGLGHDGPLIDLSHGIPPQDILSAALALEDAFPYLPTGSVVVAVVDPGVGGARRAIALQHENRFVVAPDNGLLTPLLSDSSDVRIITKGGPIQPHRSATFHGRDVFAPAAALLATRARSFDDIGQPATNPVRLGMPKSQVSEDGLRATLTVVAVDPFGNLTLSHSLRDAPIAIERGLFTCAFGPLGPLRRTYGDVPPGNSVVYWNSAGRLEVAINGGNAAKELGMGFGSLVRFEGE